MIIFTIIIIENINFNYIQNNNLKNKKATSIITSKIKKTHYLNQLQIVIPIFYFSFDLCVYICYTIL